MWWVLALIILVLLSLKLLTFCGLNAVLYLRHQPRQGLAQPFKSIDARIELSSLHPRLQSHDLWDESALPKLADF